MDWAVAADLLAASVRMGIPLLLLSLAELLAERSGVLNIGLEGMLLASCFASAVTCLATGSPVVGVLAGVVAAAGMMALFAGLTVLLRQDQVLTGMAVNLLAVGLTGVWYRQLFGTTGGLVRTVDLATISLPLFCDLPVAGALFRDQAWLTWLALLPVPALAFALRYWGVGLALEAAGQLPEAAEAAGWRVMRIRLGALGLGAILVGMAGAHLALVHAHTFIEGMSAGRGFIALAVVIFGRWMPFGVLAASLFFGLALAAQFHFQALGVDVPYQVVRSVPYVVTLLALTLVGGGRRQAPSALGRPLSR